LQVAGVAWITDLDPAQHLPDDDLDVLVVDAHPLQPVHILDFLHQISRQAGNATQAQDVVRHQLTFGDDVAFVDIFAFEDADLAPLGNQDVGVVAVAVDDFDALLALGALAEANGAGCFRQHRRRLRLACLEQVRHPRQTTGDVARLGGFLWNASADVANDDLLPVLDHDNGPRWQAVGRRDFRIGEIELLAIVVHQLDYRAQILVA